jgi:hypothetical protein
VPGSHDRFRRAAYIDIFKTSSTTITGAGRIWHWRRTARSPGQSLPKRDQLLLRIGRSNRQALDGSSRFRRWVGSLIVTSGAPPERHTQLISTPAVFAPSSPCLQPRMATYRVPSGSAICSEDHRSLGSASARIGTKSAVSQFPRTTITITTLDALLRCVEGKHIVSLVQWGSGGCERWTLSRRW